MIALLTDFGNTDIYPGIMKAVIKGISPGSDIIDITHSVKPQNIRQAAFLLKASYRYFPPKSIFLCVVDPGVGSERKPIAASFGNYFFVGPDNGLISFAAVGNPMRECITLGDNAFRLKKVSPTFHGRDIFAPAAAHIDRKAKLKDLGIPLSPEDLVRIDDPKLIHKSDGSIECEILHIDSFGNAITSYDKGIDAIKEIYAGNVTIRKTGLTFSDVETGDHLAYTGSSGYLELAGRNSCIAGELNLNIGDSVIILLNNS